MPPNEEPAAPAWGPGFLGLTSWSYRAEYAVATLALLLILFGWRLGVLHALTATGVALVVFWAVWPDLLAFVPIGLASRRGREWPSWGPGIYNVGHSFLTWGAVFVLWSVLQGTIEWPLLAWAGHITADRAVGFYLRAPVVRAVGK